MLNAAHHLIHRMTARISIALRIAILTTVAVAATLALMSTFVFFMVRAQFANSLDDSMLRRANLAVAEGFSKQTILSTPRSSFAIADIHLAVVQGGQLVLEVGRETLPTFVGYPEIEVSIGQREHSARTVRLDGVPYRVVAVQSEPGTALVLAQSLEPTERTLDHLRVILLLLSAGGVAIAGLAGWVVATNGLRPVRRLTAATERVARTNELLPIDVRGRDEVARLTNSFNVMLQALDASQERQRQLVADAGHELRTPLTSLRTNIELMTLVQNSPDRQLTPEQRTEMMSDVEAQLNELTTLIGDLVELARDEPLQRSPEPFDFSEAIETAVDRVRRRAPGITFEVSLQPWTIVGEPPLIERAVINVLDNAAKWSPPDGTVWVRLHEGTLTVTDQGPGIAEEDLPLIFDRFYRSSEARTLPGSGLGLSIVRRAIERHGGTARAFSPNSGGTILTITIPGASPTD